MVRNGVEGVWGVSNVLIRHGHHPGRPLHCNLFRIPSFDILSHNAQVRLLSGAYGIWEVPQCKLSIRCSSACDDAMNTWRMFVQHWICRILSLQPQFCGNANDGEQKGKGTNKGAQTRSIKHVGTWSKVGQLSRMPKRTSSSIPMMSWCRHVQTRAIGWIVHALNLELYI